MPPMQRMPTNQSLRPQSVRPTALPIRSECAHGGGGGGIVAGGRRPSRITPLEYPASPTVHLRDGLERGQHSWACWTRVPPFTDTCLALAGATPSRNHMAQIRKCHTPASQAPRTCKQQSGLARKHHTTGEPSPQEGEGGDATRMMVVVVGLVVVGVAVVGGWVDGWVGVDGVLWSVRWVDVS